LNFKTPVTEFSIYGWDIGNIVFMKNSQFIENVKRRTDENQRNFTWISIEKRFGAEFTAW